jgi:DNA polymerase III subunit gamma/tau
MLLKGGEETGKAANPRAAAEMVLIRLSYTADLPSPDELIRMLGGEGALVRSGKPAPAESAASRNAPLNSAEPAAPASPMPQAASAMPIPFADDGSSGEDDGFFDADYEASLDELAGGARVVAFADPRSFDDVIAVAGERRDMMLKVHLEDRVSLVKFDAAAGSIDLFLLPGAPPHIANELREKLNAWTGRKWVVVLSKSAGERPRGEVRREREAAELEALKSHPAVKAILDQFPDAKIADIRPLISAPRDETGTG